MFNPLSVCLSLNKYSNNPRELGLQMHAEELGFALTCATIAMSDESARVQLYDSVNHHLLEEVNEVGLRSIESALLKLGLNLDLRDLRDNERVNFFSAVWARYRDDASEDNSVAGTLDRNVLPENRLALVKLYAIQTITQFREMASLIHPSHPEGAYLMIEAQRTGLPEAII